MIVASNYESLPSNLDVFVRPSTACQQQDERLLRAARRRLRASGYPELANLDCEVIDGLVVLDGVLPSYYLKQLAQEAVLTLDDVECVRNLVTVHWPDSL